MTIFDMIARDARRQLDGLLSDTKDRLSNIESWDDIKVSIGFPNKHYREIANTLIRNRCGRDGFLNDRTVDEMVRDAETACVI